MSLGKRSPQQLEYFALQSAWRGFVKKDLGRVLQGDTQRSTLGGVRVHNHKSKTRKLENVQDGGRQLEEHEVRFVDDYRVGEDGVPPFDIPRAEALKAVAVVLEQDHHLPHVVDVFGRRECLDLVEALFWTVFHSSFQVEPRRAAQRFRRRALEGYAKLELDLPRAVMDVLPYAIIEAVVILFEKVFPGSRETFNDGFIVHVYRECTSELFGFAFHPMTVQQTRKSLFRARFALRRDSGCGGDTLQFTPLRNVGTGIRKPSLWDDKPRSPIDASSTYLTTGVSPVVEQRWPGRRLYLKRDCGRDIPFSDPWHLQRRRAIRSDFLASMKAAQVEHNAEERLTRQSFSLPELRQSRLSGLVDLRGDTPKLRSERYSEVRMNKFLTRLEDNRKHDVRQVNGDRRPFKPVIAGALAQRARHRQGLHFRSPTARQAQEQVEAAKLSEHLCAIVRTCEPVCAEPPADHAKDAGQALRREFALLQSGSNNLAIANEVCE